MATVTPIETVVVGDTFEVNCIIDTGKETVKARLRCNDRASLILAARTLLARTTSRTQDFRNGDDISIDPAPPPDPTKEELATRAFLTLLASLSQALRMDAMGLAPFIDVTKVRAQLTDALDANPALRVLI